LQNEQVEMLASCSNAAGTIIAGARDKLLWPQAGGSLNLDVPVIGHSAPASYQVGATTFDLSVPDLASAPPAACHDLRPACIRRVPVW
jgi:hypothetical protein